jgi:hypothetical protein
MEQWMLHCGIMERSFGNDGGSIVMQDGIRWGVSDGSLADKTGHLGGERSIQLLVRCAWMYCNKGWTGG